MRYYYVVQPVSNSRYFTVLTFYCAHEQEFVNRILYLIITVLVVLIVRDVYQVALMRRKTLEKEQYVKAVRSSSEAWTTGEMFSAGTQLNVLFQ